MSSDGPEAAAPARRTRKRASYGGPGEDRRLTRVGAPTLLAVGGVLLSPTGCPTASAGRGAEPHGFRVKGKNAAAVCSGGFIAGIPQGQATVSPSRSTGLLPHFCPGVWGLAPRVLGPERPAVYLIQGLKVRQPVTARLSGVPGFFESPFFKLQEERKMQTYGTT